MQNQALQHQMAQNHRQVYQTNQVNTANPAELTLMLYNGAIKFVKQSKAALEEKDYEQAHNYNMRVQDIITELEVTLNRDIPISENLLQLYDFLMHRLIEANIQKNSEILDEVEDFFVQFRDTWREAMLLVKKGNES